MDVAENDGELGVEQPFLWSFDDADPQQRAVDETIATEQRDPGDHANYDRGPERYRAEEQEHCLRGSAAQLERKEIGDEETEYRRNRPHDDAEFHGDQVGTVSNPLRKDLPVIVQGEARDQDLIGLVAEKADHNDQCDRRGEKQQEHHRERQCLQVGNE